MAIADEPDTDAGISQEVQNRIQSLERHVVLVYPSMGWWKGMYQIPGAKVTVDDVAVEDKATTRPQVKLLELSERGRHYKKEFQEIDSARAAIVEAYSVQFPIRGVRLIPRAAVSNFFADLVGPTGTGGAPLYDPEREEAGKKQSILYRLRELLASFEAEYDAIMAAAAATKPELWDRVKHLVPHRAAISNKFYLRVTAVRLAGTDNQTLDSEELRQMSGFLQASMKEQVDEAITAMLTEPRQQMADAITNLRELVEREGRVSTRSFNPLTAAIEKLRMFSFMTTPELLNSLNQLEARMRGVTPSELNVNTLVSSGLGAVLNSVQAEINDDVASADIYARFNSPRSVIV